MKIPLLDSSGKKLKELEVPYQFEEPVRIDIIKKVFFVYQDNNRQPYGTSPMAGNKHSVYLSKRRRAYRSVYGYGISRTPRKILSRRGRRLYWVGAMAPNTVGGRRAHPPKSEKNYDKSIPIKEKRKALRSAIAATLKKELVESRGHKLPGNYPFAVHDKFCKLSKTKQVVETLERLDFKEELDRTKEKKIRAGKGKMRGRRYKTKRGLLIVVSENCPLMEAAKNIPGVEVSLVRSLNAELLAPGGVPGRLTLWTEGAVKIMAKEGLFA